METKEEEKKLIVKQGVPRYYETMNQFYDLDLFCSMYLMGIKGIVQIISGYLDESQLLEAPGKQLTLAPRLPYYWQEGTYWKYRNMIQSVNEIPGSSIVQIISGYLNESHMLQEVAGKQLCKPYSLRCWWIDIQWAIMWLTSWWEARTDAEIPRLAFLIASYCNEIEFTQDVPGKQIAKGPYVPREWWKMQFTGWGMFNLYWRELAIRDRIIDDLCFRLHTNLFKTNVNMLARDWDRNHWTWTDGTDCDEAEIDILNYNPYNISNIPLIVEALCPHVIKISKEYEAGDISLIKGRSVRFTYGKRKRKRDEFIQQAVEQIS